MNTPQKTGWHWFLPDENCSTPTGLIRIDKPVVLLVGQARLTRDGETPLVVRLPNNIILQTRDMTGAWEEIREPIHMTWLAQKRIKEKLEQDST